MSSLIISHFWNWFWVKIGMSNNWIGVKNDSSKKSWKCWFESTFDWRKMWGWVKVKLVENMGLNQNDIGWKWCWVEIGRKRELSEWLKYLKAHPAPANWQATRVPSHLQWCNLSIGLCERENQVNPVSDELKMGLSNKGRVKTSQVNTVCTGIIFLLWAAKAGSTCISGGPPRCPVGWSPCRSRHWGKSLAVCPAVFLTPGCWWIFRGEGNIKKMRKNTHLGVQVISLRGFLQIGQVAFTLK